MNRVKKAAVTLAAAAGITVGAAAPALAAVEYVGGGTWYYGVTGTPGSGISYSDYYHGSVCHGSTAVGTYTVRDSAPAGQWALASAPRAWMNNQAYWRTTC